MNGLRLGIRTVQVKDDERGLAIAVFAELIKDLFVALYELHLDVELARRLLNLGQEEQVVNKGKDFRLGSFLTVAERFDGRLLEETLGLLLTPSTTHSSTITTATIVRALVAIAVVHGSGEGLASTAAAVLALLAPVLGLIALALPALLVGGRALLIGGRATAHTTAAVPPSALA